MSDLSRPGVQLLPDEKIVLVTGASGFVGRRLCELLDERGWQVRAAVRKAAGLRLHRGQVVEAGDLQEQKNFQALLAGCQFVVHLAGRAHVMRDLVEDPLEQYLRTNTEVTRQLAAAAAEAGVQRLVFVSTIKAGGESTPRGGIDGGWPEDQPVAPVGPYSISKARAEEAVREVGRRTGLEYVIVRPPLVYGPGVRANFLSLMDLVDSGMPLPLASIVNRRSLIGVGNLADFLACCLEHPQAANQVFQVADDLPLSTPQLIRAIAMALGRPAHLFRFPPILLKWAAKTLGKGAVWERLGSSLEVDGSKAAKLLEWRPPFAMARELEVTAAWYRQNRAGKGAND